MTRHPRDERGAIMVLMAIGMVAMVLMVAIVVDLSSTRSLRSQARATADAAATAGVLDLKISTSQEACQTALSYAFTNLGGAQPSNGDLTGKCSSVGMGATCVSGVPRTASVPLGDTVVQVTNPVPNGHPLLRATVVGGGSGQAADASPAAVDGGDCQRLGVEITRPQSLFFGGVATGRSGSFSVHSVARYQPTQVTSSILPAMVVLNPTACNAIETGNGRISVEKTPTGPGVIYSDSDGSGCSAPGVILNAGSSGSLRAAALSPTIPGELAWFSASPNKGFINTTSRTKLENGTTADLYDYVGRLYARETRTKRASADARYHCKKVEVTPLTPLCTGGDPIEEAHALALATTAPAGYATTNTCSSGSGFPAIVVNTFVNCDVFEVKGGPMVVNAGVTVIFKGRLKLAAGGTLAVNVPSLTPPAVGTGALPVAAADVQSRLIVGSTAIDAVDFGSGLVYMAQTTLYSRGGFNMQASSRVLWTSPTAGLSKSLLYWSESTQDFTFQGGPRFDAAGVVFHGSGGLKLGGNAEIDLTRVQLWVDKVTLSGGPVVKLKPDPNNSIKIAQAGSSLIR